MDAGGEGGVCGGPQTTAGGGSSGGSASSPGQLDCLGKWILGILGICGTNGENHGRKISSPLLTPIDQISAIPKIPELFKAVQLDRRNGRPMGLAPAHPP